MTLVVVLVVVAAVAWYLQGQRRPGAGSSAAAEARRLRTPVIRLADLLGIETAAGQRARRFAAGAVGEKATAALLRTLAREGWIILHDLALPASDANVDHLAIAPSGRIFLVESKQWSGDFLVHSRGTRLFHGEVDVDYRLDGLRYGARTVARVLGCPVLPLVAMHLAPVKGDGVSVGAIRIVPAALVCARLRGLARHPGHDLSQAAVAALVAARLPSHGRTR
ncbi:nuclease-related domain-containing protein [Streptomyces microflavus]|uniref:nuclease-related domain-containing protein n=1 Tax=Streptomyces microflavus TaxID=1919 RepID=UPI00364E6A48